MSGCARICRPHPGFGILVRKPMMSKSSVTLSVLHGRSSNSKNHMTSRSFYRWASTGRTCLGMLRSGSLIKSITQPSICRQSSPTMGMTFLILPNALRSTGCLRPMRGGSRAITGRLASRPIMLRCDSLTSKSGDCLTLWTGAAMRIIRSLSSFPITVFSGRKAAVGQTVPMGTRNTYSIYRLRSRGCDWPVLQTGGIAEHLPYPN